MQTSSSGFRDAEAIESLSKSLRDDGWTHQPFEGFIAHVGGLWERVSLNGQEYGFIAQAMHANRNGVVHGGMLTTFIDRAFGQTARRSSEAVRGATISLTTNFIRPMTIGSFTSLTPRLVHLTSRTAFMEGSMMCEGEVIATAQGVWRLTRNTE